MINNLTVTIGIPAYNEQVNIGSLLKSVLAQKVNLKCEVIVFSDGSTDQTVNEVLRVKDKKTKLHMGKLRRGKAYRMNQMIVKARGEVVVFIDADVRIRSVNMLSEMIAPFFKYQNVGVVGGNVIPRNGKNLLQKAIISSVKAYDRARLEVRNGDNFYSCKGPLLALSKPMAKKLDMPSIISGTDTFIYFKCKALGLKFFYNHLSKVYYKVPSSFTEHINQHIRCNFNIVSIGSQFGDIYETEKKLMRFKLYKQMCLGLINNPIQSVYIFALNTYARFKFLFSSQGTALWSMADSTK